MNQILILLSQNQLKIWSNLIKSGSNHNYNLVNLSNEFIPAVDLALPLRQDGAVESLVAVVAREARFVPGAPSTAHQLCDEHLERRTTDN